MSTIFKSFDGSVTKAFRKSPLGARNVEPFDALVLIGDSRAYALNLPSLAQEGLDQWNAVRRRFPTLTALVLHLYDPAHSRYWDILPASMPWPETIEYERISATLSRGMANELFDRVFRTTRTPTRSSFGLHALIIGMKDPHGPHPGPEWDNLRGRLSTLLNRSSHGSLRVQQEPAISSRWLHELAELWDD